MFSKLFHQLIVLGFACSCLWLAQPGVAAPPTNDTCVGAVVIPTGGPFPYYTAITDLKEATTSADPAPPMIGDCTCDALTRVIWYKFTPGSTRLFTISCSGDTATTVQDTYMAIYTSSGGCGGSFSSVGCDDDAGDLQSAISTTLSSNVTYYILVGVSCYSPPPGNNTMVQLRVTQPVAPSNDVCSGAETIPGAGPFPYLTSVTDTTLATTAGDPPAPSCWPDRIRSVWYRFTPGATMTYELSLCTNSATTVYETVMAIYTSASGCGGPFTQLSCNHTNPCGDKLRSALTLTLTNGVTYFIVAWEGVTYLPNEQSYIPGETDLQLRVARSLPPTLTSFMRQPNGTFVLRFTGQTTQTYWIQASTNLVTWSTLGSATDNGDGSFTFQDPAAAGLRTRFYRVQAP